MLLQAAGQRVEGRAQAQSQPRTQQTCKHHVLTHTQDFFGLVCSVQLPCLDVDAALNKADDSMAAAS